MKIILLIFIIVLSLMLSAFAELVTIDEAQTVADNWIKRTIIKKGSWGDASIAEIGDVSYLKYEDRLIGYVCNVEPEGFIVVSIHKTLEPIKGYSENGRFDQDCDDPIADIIKKSMLLIIESIENKIGPIELAKDNELNKILHINYRQIWDKINNFEDIPDYQRESSRDKEDYQEGDYLVKSEWRQGPPFNLDCPDMGCEYYPTWDQWPVHYAYNENAVSGCVAIAGAQIMRHWAWPPDRVGQDEGFDWPQMADWYYRTQILPGVFDYTDRDGAVITPVQIDAVAHLIRDIGIYVDMNYGCDGSGADLFTLYDSTSLEMAMKSFYRYDSDIEAILRSPLYVFPEDWFPILQSEFDNNRPVAYGYLGHAFLADGWDNDGLMLVHFNMGWGVNNHQCGDFPSNWWYTLTGICDHELFEEVILRNIKPEVSMGSSLMANDYELESYRYRYFNTDCHNIAIGFDFHTTFEAGQNLQFLPGITVTCHGFDEGRTIRFESAEGGNDSTTSLYSRGDRTKGIDVKEDGVLVLHDRGCITFPK